MSLMTGSFETDGSARSRDTSYKRAQTRQSVVLDLAHLRTYTLGAVDLEREILALFLAELPKSCALLKTAADAKAWHMAAHTLKGSALAVGAGQLASAGAVAEKANFEVSADREAAIAGVIAAIERVNAEVAQLQLG
jgi:HPt (histidine-containing phosphotransfer) domain-containing protein